MLALTTHQVSSTATIMVLFLAFGRDLNNGAVQVHLKLDMEQIGNEFVVQHEQDVRRYR